MTNEALIEFIEKSLIPTLDKDRTTAILSDAELHRMEMSICNNHAHAAAIQAGTEKDAITTSERLRMLAWQTVWDSTQAEALRMSHVLGYLGMAIGTIDLVGTYGYTADDYRTLIGPFTKGFPEFPVPEKEEG